MQEFQINSNEAGQRFDKYLKKLLAGAPGSFVYKMLRKKNIVLNGKKADGTEKLALGDTVKLFLSDETYAKFAGKPAADGEVQRLKQLSGELKSGLRELKVVYEDADILVIDKPAGMLSQKAEAGDISANEYILAYLLGTGELTEEMLRTFRPSVCNRLDRNTSGLLIAGKTLRGLQGMAASLKERSVEKYYRCIVKGELKEDMYLKGWLKKDEASNKVTILPEHAVIPAEECRGENGFRCIETAYHPLRAARGYTELEVHLITGRSHQIRAHLAGIGHPIVGDAKYGDRRVNEIFRREAGISAQLLHAWRIVFPQEMEFPQQKEIKIMPGEAFQRAWNHILN
ncbi:MAG: RluA family pseudouridine synthase [Roseburia sp.]